MIAHVGDVAAQAGDRGEAHRAGAEHGDDRRAAGVLASSDDGSGEQRGVDAAGERLDEHGALVGHVVAMRWSCDSWATNSGAQPPPVEQQNPVWMPGSSGPVARWA